jgi:hypothetical protein
MALPLDKLGTTYGPVTTVIDGERARAYAAATNDPNPAYDAGKVAPPVFGVVPVCGAASEGALVVKHGLAEVV